MSLSLLAIDGNLSHDASVTVIRDGEIFAVECERLDRVKKSVGYDFSVVRREDGFTWRVSDAGNFTKAIEYCLSMAGVQKVDLLVHTHAYKFLRFLRLERFLKDPKAVLFFPSHHDAHAMSAYYGSGFERAAVLVVDGSGPEHGHDQNSLQSLYWFDGGRVSTVKQTFATPSHPLGIGLNYFLHTLLLGMEEGSIMGLSSYGDPSRYPDRLLVDVEGHVYVDTKKLGERVSTHCGEARPETLFRFYGIDGIEDVLAARRRPHQTFLADIAAKVQQETEERMIQLAAELHEATGCADLCVAGGVGLNSVANHKILEQTPFRRIFVQPAANDAGITLGIALYAWNCHLRQPRRVYTDVFFGGEYADEACRAAVAEFPDRLVVEELGGRIVSSTAALLEAGEVVAWFQGRLEMGPRALGHRSLLAHPGSQAIRDRVNRIKGREPWRPLAPAVLEEEADDYFRSLAHNPYMLLVAQATERARRETPGIVHVDGTARVQTVSRAENPILYDLIAAFRDRTGIPMLINTSLNVKGEPLIESPRQAIVFLLTTEVDALVLGSLLVRRKPAARPFARTAVEIALEAPPQRTGADLVTCLNRDARSFEVTAIERFKDSYLVQIALIHGSYRRSFDLSVDVSEGRVTELFDNRTSRAIGPRHRVLFAEFADALERCLATV